MAKNFEFEYIKSFRLCSLEHFAVVKGIAIVILLIAYVAAAFFGLQQASALVGVVCSVFLFCSGYGVCESAAYKNGLPHYWENKVIKVWLPSVVSLVAVYTIQSSNPIGWIKDSLIGLSGWFLYILFGFYAAFWFVYKLFQNKKAYGWVLLAVAAVAFVCLEKQSYAEVILAFPLGVLMSQFGWRNAIKQLGVAGSCVLLLALAGVSFGGYVAAKLCSINLLTNLCWLICKTAAALWIVFVPFFVQKVPVFGVFAVFGEISFGIYLFFQSAYGLLDAQADWKAVAVVTVVLLVIAGVFSWLRELLVTQNKKARRRRGAKLKGSMG